MAITKTRIVSVALSEKECQMLDALVEEFGCTKSELLRSFLRERYLKSYPPYRMKNLESPADPELEPEQYAEMLQARVDRAKGTVMVPMNKIKSFFRTFQLSALNRETYEDLRGIQKTNGLD